MEMIGKREIEKAKEKECSSGVDEIPESRLEIKCGTSMEVKQIMKIVFHFQK